MIRSFRDDMGRDVMLSSPPQRIISLVPSDTESLFALGLGERVVGRTAYCEEPADKVSSIPCVGGTKDVDVDAVCDLDPDMVFANQEENARGPLEELAARGVPLFVSFPQRVAEAVSSLARMARVCSVEREPAVVAVIRRCFQAVSTAQEAIRTRPMVPVFVPIWLDPLMTISEKTFGSDMLRLAGARNVFADRTRRYPLKADLGLRSPLAADRVAHRDIRYPRITVDELIARAPAALLLPDEPYAFSLAEGDNMAAIGFETVPQVRHLSGKDLFWSGSRIADALNRLTQIIEALRSSETKKREPS